MSRAAPEVVVERRGRVAVVTLDRPERLNAVGLRTLADLGAVLDELETAPGVGAMVVTGAGRAFCAGADVKGLTELGGAGGFADFLQSFTGLYRRLERSPKPSVAAINGLALGGGLELALACDLRIAAGRAKLGVPEIKLGILPGAGGTARLTRMLPPGLAKQMILTGAPISATEAWRIGLVNEVVDASTGSSSERSSRDRVAPAEPVPGGAPSGGDPPVVQRALEVAAALAELPARALAAGKRLVDDGREMSLDAALTFERETVTVLFSDGDSREGLSAFLEKRPPRFNAD